MAASASKAYSFAQPNSINLVCVFIQVAPGINIGALTDVFGGLPPALMARGHHMMIIAPRNDQSCVVIR